MRIGPGPEEGRRHHREGVLSEDERRGQGQQRGEHEAAQREQRGAVAAESAKVGDQSMVHCNWIRGSKVA